MKKNGKNNRISILRLFNLIYIKLFRIHDTPQRIALGVGIGVFAGILPGIGPLTAIFLAVILRANRASALLGSLLTNTWISILTFLLSIKIGSVIMGKDWHVTHKNWVMLIRNFKIIDLIRLPVLRIILPVIVGYMAIGILAGMVVYLMFLLIVSVKKHKTLPPEK